METLEIHRFSVIEYVPGKYLESADALSRYPVDNENVENLEPFNWKTANIYQINKKKCCLVNDSIITNEAEYKKGGENYRNMLIAIDLATHGGMKRDWESTGDLYRFRKLLTVKHGIVFYNETQVVLPKSMRKKTLELMHKGHAGEDNMMMFTKRKVFWPKIN